MMNETQKILSQGERIIWQARPQFGPYFVSSLGYTFYGVIWGAFLIPFIWVGFTQDVPWFFFIFMSPFILIGLGLLSGPIFSLIQYKYIWFTLTDKRAIVQKGWIGRDFDYVDYDKVTSASVYVGIVDKLFGKNSGSIFVYQETGSPFKLSHITDPYATYEVFKKLSYDVKADINFPNVMRPKENTGYQTEYILDNKNKSPEKS